MLLWLITPIVTCLTVGVSACLNKSSVRFYIVTCEAESDVKVMMAAGRIGKFDVGGDLVILTFPILTLQCQPCCTVRTFNSLHVPSSVLN
jgi:hypothetical protein